MKTMGRITYLFSIAAGAAILAASAPASAQEAQSGFALDRFQPAFAGDRMFGVPSPFVAGRLTPHAMIMADYARNPLVLRREGEELGVVVGNQLVLHINGGLALWNRIGVNLDVPIAVYQSGEDPSVGSDAFPSPNSAQIGDLRLGLRGRILGDYFDAFQLAVGGYVWFPTGSSDAGSFVSDGSIRALPQLIVGGLINDRFIWTAAAGPEIRGAKTVANVTQGTSFQGGVGLGYLLGEQRNLQVGLESSISTVLDDPNARNTNAEVLADLRFRFLHDFEVGLGAGPGLTSGQGTPSLRGVAMFAYTPEQEKAKPPQPDRDKDGIFDVDDACVDVPGVADADPKKNGCPPPSDKDKDGIFDDKDACPTEPGPANPDPKKNGCPPPSDKDKDGIIDAEDACVDVKGVPDPEPKKNGCPPDRDGDGVYDEQDACIDIPGRKTNDPATNGCPGDTDSDTIRDDKDACPTIKGKPNPDPQKNGCPVAVRLSEKEIIILQQVQFDTAKATIKPVSNPLLDEVANVLKEHPEIAKIEVQGHTDNRGGEAYNDRLSQSRSDAVRKALIKRGVEADRLTAKGYGQHEPIDTNDTDAGRQKNRRVQFKILEKKPVEPAK